MSLIKEEELYFLGKGLFGRAFAKAIMKTAKLDKVNEVYNKLSHNESEEYAGKALELLNVSYSSNQEELLNVPQNGGIIIIANHPTGAIDGLIMIDLISKVRPDVKFMGNFLLSRIEPLKRYFIDIDPFEDTSRSNYTGIKASLDYVKSGGALVIFPAGNVSFWAAIIEPIW